MTNQTWRETTKRTCRLARIRVFADGDFDDDTKLDDPQQAAKYFVQLFHEQLGLLATNHYAKRRFDLPVDTSNHTYPIDTGVNPEFIDWHSWRNLTSGSATFGPLEVWDQNKFRDEYPDPSDIGTGAPRAVVILPVERTEMSPVRKVRIVPNPDAEYQLEYVGKLNPYELTSGDSLVLFPPEYNHVLVMFSWAQLESALGEGKEGVLLQMADRAAKQVRLAAGAPSDLRRAVKTIGSFRKDKPRWLYWWRTR